MRVQARRGMCSIFGCRAGYAVLLNIFPLQTLTLPECHQGKSCHSGTGVSQVLWGISPIKSANKPRSYLCLATWLPQAALLLLHLPCEIRCFQDWRYPLPTRTAVLPCMEELCLFALHVNALEASQTFPKNADSHSSLSKAFYNRQHGGYTGRERIWQCIA